MRAVLFVGFLLFFPALILISRFAALSTPFLAEVYACLHWDILSLLPHVDIAPSTSTLTRFLAQSQITRHLSVSLHDCILPQPAPFLFV